MQAKRIEEWDPVVLSVSAVEQDLNGLAELLHACVQGGASVGFVLPFSFGEARGYWREKVLPEVLAGARRVLVARRDEAIAGSVQLIPASMPNQRHRADVAKLLVHPDARRQGIARSLMVSAEELARTSGRTLLTLDTVHGSSAEALYRSLGFVASGVIPRYARAAASPDLEDTCVLYKELSRNTESPNS